MFRNVEIRKHPVGKKRIYMKMSKFVHFRAQRDLNGAEITVTMTTESHTWPSTIWHKKTSPAAIMRPERAPSRAKMDPQNSQRVPKWPPGDKQWNFNDFRKLFGLFLEPFWAQNQSKKSMNFSCCNWCPKKQQIICPKWHKTCYQD